MTPPRPRLVGLAGGGSAPVAVATLPPLIYMYLRISESRDGDLISVTDQRNEIDPLMARLGLTLDAPPFIDNDTSATKGLERPAHDALIDTIKAAGGRKVIVLLWHVDRLYRNPGELEQLLKLVEKYPIELKAVQGGGFDLNTPEGRLFARQLVTFAAFEQDHKRANQKKTYRRQAEAGAWHGARRFGYQLDGEGGALLDPNEAPVIRGMATRFLAGESLNSIYRWVVSTGVPPLRAEQWSQKTVRDILLAPRIAGLRSYTPADRIHGRVRIGEAAVVAKGRWPEIVSREEWERMHAALMGSVRLTPVRESRWFLSGIARCGKEGCGNTLVAYVGSRGRQRYHCKKDPARPERGGLGIERVALDAWIGEAIVRRLGRATPPPDSGETSAHATAFAAVVAAQERVEEVEDMFDGGEIDRAQFRRLNERAQGRLAEAQRALASLTQSAILSTLPIGDEAAMRAWWEAETTTIGLKRSVAQSLLLELVILPRAGQSIGPHFDSSRVKVTWAF